MLRGDIIQPGSDKNWWHHCGLRCGSTSSLWDFRYSHHCGEFLFSPLQSRIHLSTHRGAVGERQSTLRLSSQQMSAPLFLLPSTKFIRGKGNKRSVTFPRQGWFSTLTGPCKRQRLVLRDTEYGQFEHMGSLPSHWRWYFKVVFTIFSRKIHILGQNQPFTSPGNLVDEPLHTFLQVAAQVGFQWDNGSPIALRSVLMHLSIASLLCLANLSNPFLSSLFQVQASMIQHLPLWKWAHLALSLSLSNDEAEGLRP